MKRYELWFEDGYKTIVIGSEEEMLFVVDKEIKKGHGECIACFEMVGYSKWTGLEEVRVW